MNFQKIRRDRARNLFHDGITIYLLPNKVRMGNDWIQPYPINVLKSQEHSFDILVANFEMYNCNSETGRDASYYIEEITSFVVLNYNTVMFEYSGKDVLSRMQKELNNFVKKNIHVSGVAQNGNRVEIHVG